MYNTKQFFSSAIEKVILFTLALNPIYVFAAQPISLFDSDTIHSTYLEVSDTFKAYRWYEGLNSDSISYTKEHSWSSQEGYKYILVKSNSGQWFSDTVYSIPEDVSYSELNTGRFEFDLSFLPPSGAYKLDIIDNEDSLIYSRIRGLPMHRVNLLSGSYKVRYYAKRTSLGWTSPSPWFNVSICIDFSELITTKNVDVCYSTTGNGGVFKPRFPGMANYNIDYLWSTGDTTRGSQLDTGTHWVKIVLNGGCTYWDTVVVENITVPDVCVEFAYDNNPCTIDYYNEVWSIETLVWKFYSTHNTDNMLVSWDPIPNAFRYELSFENEAGQDSSFLLGPHRVDYRFRFDRADWSSFVTGENSIVRMRAIIDTNGTRDTTMWSCDKLVKAQYTNGHHPCNFDIGNSFLSGPSHQWWFNTYNHYRSPIDPGCAGRPTAVAGKSDFRPDPQLDNYFINKDEVYPNPADNFINVISQPGSEIFIYDMNGSLRYNNGAVNRDSSIDISNWPIGVYSIVINHRKGNSFHRLIKR